MFGWSRKTRCEAVRELAPLRVSDDLSADEADMVDRHVQHCSCCRAELESFQKSRDLLLEASAVPAGLDCGPDGSLWARIEPRLGPAGKWRRRAHYWVTTPQLAAACLGLFGFTMYNETAQRMAGPMAVAKAGVSQRINAVAGNGNRPVMFGLNGSPQVQRQFEAPVAEQSATMTFQFGNARFDGDFIPELGVVLCDAMGRDGEHRFQVFDGGTFVHGMIRGWLADLTGIREGDAIVAVNDRPVFSPSEVKAALRNGKQSELHMRILRAGVPHDITIRLRQAQPVRSILEKARSPVHESFDRMRFRSSDAP